MIPFCDDGHPMEDRHVSRASHERGHISPPPNSYVLHVAMYNWAKVSWNMWYV